MEHPKVQNCLLMEAYSEIWLETVLWKDMGWCKYCCLVKACHPYHPTCCFPFHGQPACLLWWKVILTNRTLVVPNNHESWSNNIYTSVPQAFAEYMSLSCGEMLTRPTIKPTCHVASDTSQQGQGLPSAPLFSSIGLVHLAADLP